ncbi:MAG: hypothetical protein C0490_10765 [Marivirga sp.]|nr:hypothetical protein [Marivirga sp.]
MKQKIKIMKQKPALSDEEIRSYMDFDGLMASRKLVGGDPVKLKWVKRVIPVVAITAIAVWFTFYNDTNTNPQPTTESVEQNPVTSPEVEAPAAIKETIEEDKVTQKQSALPDTPTRSEQKTKEPTVHQQSKPLEDTYVQAEPLGGYDALYEYFNSQLVYPAESIKDSIQGVQTISFVINPEGKPEKVQIKQSLGEPFEKEARRLIENMPAWKPATLNGKPVSSQMSLPLTFNIQKVKIR